MPTAIQRLNFRRHSPFFLALFLGLVTLSVALPEFGRLGPGLAAVAFFATYLLMIALRVPALDGERLRRTARDDDEPAAVILAVTLLAAATSVILLFMAMADGKQGGLAEIALAFVSVVLGWLTIHTMFALHYAHLYWRPSAQRAKDESLRGGLDFPQTKSPGVWDFLYFSFVIGMTAQTSDVEITSTGMRRINLLHAVVSFFFNTILVAATVNAVVSFGG